MTVAATFDTPVSGDQFATVTGADAYREIRDHIYNLGVASFEAQAVAAYIVERWPHKTAEQVIRRFYVYKLEAWYGDERAFFWMNYYGTQPTYLPGHKFSH